MNIFLTGITGLVGTHCAELLLKHNHNITALVRKNAVNKLKKDLVSRVKIIEGDIFDYFLLEKSLENIDIVIHCAALVSFNPSNKSLMYETNIQGTQNILFASQKNKVLQFIHISSIAALGRTKDKLEIDETNKWVESDLNSNYAKTKYLSELEVWRASEEDLNVTVLQPSIILGEGDLKSGSSKIFDYVKKQKPFYSEGLINYVDVKDVANAVLISINNKDAQNQSFILNEGFLTYQEFFTKIAHRFNVKVPFIKINLIISEIAWRVEAFKSLFSKGEPLITKETARSSRSKFIYKNKKAIDKLGLQFVSLDETLDRVCKFYNQ